ncbi:hypothetical protein FOZ62_023262 [Perkinsus olseni]|uniref:Uncharacterized protein n=1 Tax=Perkinsus olseni TaxID=32597 RepID=A0A7J6NG36_PEROL|nr:hypothetical protein FOZ62_023262 [Perkinsus olseni]
MSTIPSKAEMNPHSTIDGRDDNDYAVYAPLEALAKLNCRIKELNAAIEGNAVETAYDASNARFHDEIIECRMQQVALQKVLLAQHMSLRNALSSRGEPSSVSSLSTVAALANLASATVALAEAYACGFYLEQSSGHLKSAMRIAEVDIPVFIESEGDIAVVEALNERIQADVAGCQGYACYQALIARQREQLDDEEECWSDGLAVMQQEVLSLLDAALNQTRRGYGDKDLRCARLHDLIAKIHASRMQNNEDAGINEESLEAAKEHYEEAKAIRANRLGEHSRAVLESSVGIAQAEMLAGREQEAVKIMVETLQSVEETVMEASASEIEPWFFIDNVLRLSHWTASSDDTPTNDLATQMLVKAHTLATKNYKASDRRVVDVTRDLALRAVKSGEYTKARQYLADILEVERQVHGQYSAPVCRTFNALASVLIALEHMEDASAVLSK